MNPSSQPAEPPADTDESEQSPEPGRGDQLALTQTSQPRWVRLILGRNTLPTPMFVEGRDGGEALRAAVRRRRRDAALTAGGTFMVAVPVTLMSALLATPGDDEATWTWWWQRALPFTVTGYDPAAVSSALVAIVVTLFVAHTWQSNPPTGRAPVTFDTVAHDPTERHQERALADADSRVVVLDGLVWGLAVTSAVTSWCLLQLPGRNEDPRGVNFLVPLLSVIVSCVIASLTSRSDASKTLADLTREAQTGRLKVGVEAYRAPLEGAMRRRHAPQHPLSPDDQPVPMSDNEWEERLSKEISDPARLRLHHWRRDFPWPPVITGGVVWVVASLGAVELVSTDGLRPVKVSLILALAVVQALVGVSLISASADGIVTRTAAGRLGFVSSSLVPVLVVIGLYSAGGGVILYDNRPAGLWLLSWSLMPLGEGWWALRSARFREYVAVMMARRYLRMRTTPCPQGVPANREQEASRTRQPAAPPSGADGAP